MSAVTGRRKTDRTTQNNIRGLKTVFVQHSFFIVSLSCRNATQIFFVVFFIAAAAAFAFPFSFSQTQWHVSVDIVVFESSSSSSFQAFVFFALSSMLSSLSLIHAGKSPSTFLSLSLPPPWLVFLLVCWIPCVAVCL